jgi:hypothetical protein
MRSITSLSLTFVLLLGATTVAFGLDVRPEEEIKAVVSTCMEQVRQRLPDECDKVDDMAKKYGLALVPYLDEYAADPNKLVRWSAYRSMFLLGLDVNDVAARQKIVDKFVTAVRDDVYNGGFLANWLLGFTSADFSEASQELVREFLAGALERGNRHLRRNIILLAGVARLRSELGALERFILGEEVKLRQKHSAYMQGVRDEIARHGEWQQLSKYRKKVYSRMLAKQYWQNSLMWAALRARARMGVKEDIERCIELVRSHPDEDYRVVWLLRELSYVRQPEVVDYLYEYLKSDKMEEYKGRDVKPTSYAQRAAMALGEMLRGFPHKKNYGPDKETIERCRKWMAEQKRKQQQAEKPEEKQWDIIG